MFTFGKTLDMGSILSPDGISDMEITSRPYVVNSPPRKKSMKNICPITLTKLSASQKKNLMAYQSLLFFLSRK